MPTNQGSHRLTVWASLLTVYLLWGSTYLGIAVAIETVPPFLMAAIRFAIAGFVLLAWSVVAAHGRWQRPDLREVRDAAIPGILLFGIANGFVGWAEETVPSGIAAILIALIPLWFAILSRAFFGDRLPRLVVLGIVVGLIGVAMLVWPTDGRFAFDPLGVGILLVAPIAWTTGSLYAARVARMPSTPHVATAIQLLAGAAAVAVEAGVAGEYGRFDPFAVSDRSIVAIAYLVVMGSLVAFTAYAWLLRNAPIPLVSTYAYVNPVVAVLLGTLLLAEPLTPRTLVASAVIVVAVALVVTARGRLQRRSPAGPTGSAVPAPTASGVEPATT